MPNRIKVLSGIMSSTCTFPGLLYGPGSRDRTVQLFHSPDGSAQMSIHRQIAQMMRSLGPNISHIEFTEGSGLALNDTGDAGLDADGTCITAGTSWTTEQGKDVLVTAHDSASYPCGWTQLNQLDSYLAGSDVQWSACFHMCVTKVPQYSIGVVMSKYSRSRCNDAYSFYVAFESDMQLRFGYYSGVKTPSVVYRIAVTDNAVASVNDWFKLVVTYDGTQDGNNGLDRVKVYLDGAELASSIVYEQGAWPFDIGTSQSSDSSLSFGSAMAAPAVTCRDYGLESKWADYMLFDRVLSAAEVAQYQGGF